MSALRHAYMAMHANPLTQDLTHSRNSSSLMALFVEHSQRTTPVDNTGKNDEQKRPGVVHVLITHVHETKQVLRRTRAHATRRLYKRGL